MDYKSLKDFLAAIKRANLRGDHKVTLPMKEAIDIQNDIALLLLELKKRNTNVETTLDGGGFNEE
ncbi:uncharacterized protein METZ01_LOCUS368766 [marine metagenome]|uniref:Uncharacterized protein n=1 Tax=marine metagenome TaxID=408172 RepID=A0A382T264_9ZZZZ